MSTALTTVPKRRAAIKRGLSTVAKLARADLESMADEKCRDPRDIEEAFEALIWIEHVASEP